MYIDRRYRGRYHRRARWPFFLALLILAGAAYYGLHKFDVPGKIRSGQLAFDPSNPLHPLKPPLPSPTPTRAPASYLEEAEARYKAGRLTEASQAYAAVSALEPNNAEALQWQAWLLILRGRPTEAVPLARKAVDIKDSAMNLGVLAMALDWSEKYDEAIDYALKAVDKDPMLAEAHAFLAEVYADKNNGGRAWEEAQTAIKLNPNSPIAQRNLGYLYERQGRYRDALAAYAKAADLGPQLGYIHISAGNTYQAMADFPNALTEFQKAADANPDSPVGADQLGHAAAVSGDTDRALVVLKKAIQIDPTYGPAYAHLGSVYYSRYNYESAITNFKKAFDLGVRSEEYYYELGLCYIYLDDCENGKVWMQKALEINPDSKPARDGLNSATCKK